jgi:hypothetical protein
MIDKDVLAAHHEATQSVARFLDSSHLREDLRVIPLGFENLAGKLLQEIPSSPEVTVLMRNLVVAKDQAVRAKIYGDEHNL